MKWKHDIPGDTVTTGRIFGLEPPSLTPSRTCYPPNPPPTPFPHSSALLSQRFPNGDGETLCSGSDGRVCRVVIWLWVMFGLTNSSKSWPLRPGKGEILPSTSDLWHSGICACGSQHETRVTSNALCVQTRSPAPHSIYRGVYLVSLLIVWKTHLKAYQGIKVMEQFLIKQEHVYPVICQARGPKVCWFQLICWNLLL